MQQHSRAKRSPKMRNSQLTPLQFGSVTLLSRHSRSVLAFRFRLFLGKGASVFTRGGIAFADHHGLVKNREWKELIWKGFKGLELKEGALD